MTTEETTPEPDTDRAVAGARESFDSADYSEDFAAAGPADTTVADDAPDAVIDDPSPKAPPQYGVGPLSIREISILGVWIVAFIVSFFPIYGEVGSGPSVWTNGIDWVLTIFVPTIAVFLLILRRFSPEGIRRVGSLGVDQFASVAFSVSTVIWLGILWSSFVALAGARVFFATWVVFVEFFLMLAGVVLTVFAPFIRVLGEDFRHRTEVVAHRSARPARLIEARPATERRAPAAAAHEASAAAASTTVVDTTASDDPYAEYTETHNDPYAYAGGQDSTVDYAAAAEQDSATQATAAQAPAAHQAFWALSPVERDVVDEDGSPLFTVGPTAWALVIEDRGSSFVVRHEDGRIGTLNDISGITRG